MRQVFATILAVGASAVLCAVGQSPTRDDFRQDFDFAWRTFASSYAYFDLKATAWDDVPRLYSADLQRVTTREEFVGLLERVLDEVYDPHAQLTVNTAASPRLVPSGTDLWAAWRAVLAGTHNARRVLRLRDGDTTRVVERAARDQFGSSTGSPVTHSELRPGVGYVDSTIHSERAAPWRHSIACSATSATLKH